MTTEFRVLLCGGLGNQLFQYAFGRTLAERYRAKLQIDLGLGFSRDLVYHRSYELDAFQLSEQLELVRPSRIEMNVQRVKLAFARRKWAFTQDYLIEPSVEFYWNGADSLAGDRCYTSLGYWQNECYFSEIEELLRQELKFKRQLSAENKALASEMQSSDSVALHVRRVQYESAIDSDYYVRAISRMLKQVPGAKFYCFSDDLDWCREHLLSKYPMELIDNRALPSIEDFQLMTHCQHFVIANSSFSWWAAWLGQSAAKRVVAPARSSWDNPDAVPSAWECIDE